MKQVAIQRFTDTSGELTLNRYEGSAELSDIEGNRIIVIASPEKLEKAVETYLTGFRYHGSSESAAYLTRIIEICRQGISRLAPSSEEGDAENSPRLVVAWTNSTDSPEGA
jgi:hypothetical protein